MASSAHLWAIGYDDPDRAEQVQEEITRLAGPRPYLILLDTAVVVRHADGSYLLNRQPFPVVSNIVGCGVLGVLIGLVLAAPLTAAAVGALLGCVGSAVVSTVGIDEGFIEDVKAAMKPGTSALFVLDDAGDMEMILHGIRGLGGTVLKTNVDLERTKLIQSTLADSTDGTEQV